MAHIKLNSDFMLHSTDCPAVDDGDIQIWFVNGIIHRDDGPALTIKSLGLSYYYDQGRYHNIGSPAIVADGSLYVNNGQDITNSGRPPAVVLMCNYEPHSVGDTRAVESSNTNIWMEYGKIHRLNYPAITIRTDSYVYECHYDKGLPVNNFTIKPIVKKVHIYEATADQQSIGNDHEIVEKSWWDNLLDSILPNSKKNNDYTNINDSNSYECNTKKCCNCGDSI